MDKKRFTSKRMVPLSDGSKSYQIWDNIDLSWRLWVSLEAAGIEIDLDDVENCDDSYEGEPLELDLTDIPIA